MTSANISATGQAISSPGYDASGWLPVTVPCTVMACLLQNGWYSDLLYSQNVYSVPTAQFNASWWYRTVLPSLPGPAPGASRAILRFKGINYRANLWVNGQLLASNSTLVGTFRYFEVDLTSSLAWGSGAGANVVGVQVFRPYDRSLPATNHDTDLALTFVDWAPTPPDNNMGLWRAVELVLQGKVGLRERGVYSVLPPGEAAGGTVSDSTSGKPGASNTPASSGPVSFPYADLTLVVQARNWDGQAPAVGIVTGVVTSPDGTKVLAEVSQTVSLDPGEETAVSFTVDQYPQLRILDPQPWWPWQMGQPTLHTLTMTWQDQQQQHVDGADMRQVTNGQPRPGATSDSLTTPFGIRTATSELDGNGHRLFRVNGQRVLFRGGGWSPDLLLRPNTTHWAYELAYSRDMGLNGIRLEGKLEPDELFSMADSLGLLMLPGWCCCDSWQHWSLWGQEQWTVAQASMRDQARRLRIHASVLGFLLSSDELPPSDVEGLYLNTTEEEGWQDFAARVSAASAANSSITGPTGVKMSGPYSWVPPNYWMDDNGSQGLGGAWGFLTEGGPGEAPLTMEALQAIIPQADLWPPQPDDCWGHCGSPLGNFWMLDRFNGPLAARYGNWSSLPDYLGRAHLATFEGHRAMWDGYSRNKYAPATGVVQWMLNNAAPSNIWHLFQWDLTPGPSYFASQAALRQLHVLYGYDDGRLYVVNSAYSPQPASGPMNVSAEVFGLRDEAWWSASTVLQAGSLAGDSSTPIAGITMPSAAQLQQWAGGYGMYLLRLRAVDVASDAILDDSTYWLPLTQDVLDWADSTWWNTPVTAYANLTALAAVLQPVQLQVYGSAAAVSVHQPSQAVPAAVQWLASAAGGSVTSWTVLNVTVANTGSQPSLMTRLRVLAPNADPTAPVSDPAPVFWSDNYLTLRSGEARTLTAWLPATVLPASPGPLITATPFNNRLQ